MTRRDDFTPPLRPHDPRCPECRGWDRETYCYTCGAEGIDRPRNQECFYCTVDGCGGGPLCKYEREEWGDE